MDTLSKVTDIAWQHIKLFSNFGFNKTQSETKHNLNIKLSTADSPKQLCCQQGCMHFEANQQEVNWRCSSFRISMVWSYGVPVFRVNMVSRAKYESTTFCVVLLLRLFLEYFYLQKLSIYIIIDFIHFHNISHHHKTKQLQDKQEKSIRNTY